MTHQFGIDTVTNSLNSYIKNNLGTLAPSWMDWQYGVSQPRTLNFYWPDQPLNFPSFSVTHHSTEPVTYSEGDRADGNYKGIIRQGLMEINCWTSELIYDQNGNPVGKNEKWRMQLNQMRDMAFLMFEQNRYIPLYDFTDPQNPVSLTAITRIMDIREADTGPDPNPATKRTRILVTHRWVERWT